MGCGYSSQRIIEKENVCQPKVNGSCNDGLSTTKAVEEIQPRSSGLDNELEDVPTARESDDQPSALPPRPTHKRSVNFEAKDHKIPPSLLSQESAVTMVSDQVTDSVLEAVSMEGMSKDVKEDCVWAVTEVILDSKLPHLVLRETRVEDTFFWSYRWEHKHLDPLVNLRVVRKHEKRIAYHYLASIPQVELLRLKDDVTVRGAVWIDKVCIDQGSQDDVVTQVGRMGLYYKTGVTIFRDMNNQDGEAWSDTPSPDYFDRAWTYQERVFGKKILPMPPQVTEDREEWDKNYAAWHTVVQNTIPANSLLDSFRKALIPSPYNSPFRVVPFSRRILQDTTAPFFYSLSGSLEELCRQIESVRPSDQETPKRIHSLVKLLNSVAEGWLPAQSYDEVWGRECEGRERSEKRVHALNMLREAAFLLVDLRRNLSVASTAVPTPLLWCEMQRLQSYYPKDALFGVWGVWCEEHGVSITYADVMQSAKAIHESTGMGIQLKARTGGLASDGLFLPPALAHETEGRPGSQARIRGLMCVWVGTGCAECERTYVAHASVDTSSPESIETKRSSIISDAVIETLLRHEATCQANFAVALTGPKRLAVWQGSAKEAEACFEAGLWQTSLCIDEGFSKVLFDKNSETSFFGDFPGTSLVRRTHSMQLGSAAEELINCLVHESILDWLAENTEEGEHVFVP
eukprot:Colp12_sorted_trinity150504_noHs@30550